MTTYDFMLLGYISIAFVIAIVCSAFLHLSYNDRKHPLASVMSGIAAGLCWPGVVLFWLFNELKGLRP